MLSDLSIEALHDGPGVTLRSAERVAAAGRVLALAALAFLAWTTFLAPDGLKPSVVIAVSAAALLAGGLLALWVDRAEIRFDTQRFVRLVGVGPFARRREQDLREASAVVVTWREWTDWSGQTEPVASLGLRLDGGSATLLARCREERIEETAAAIADRLGKPLQIETVPPELAKPGRLAARLVTALLWGGMLAVSGIMLKPNFSVQTGSTRAFTQPRFPPGAASFQSGLNLFWAGRFAASEAMFTQAAREAPNDPDILNMLAYAQAEQNKLDRALGTAHEALKAAPGSANIIDTVGEMHERRREFKQAESYYRDALSRMSPFESCETHTKLGRTLVALRRPAEAIPHLEEALRYPRQPWAETAARLLRRIAPGRRTSRPAAPFIGGLPPR
jgi:hypothetical protein